MTIRPVGDWTGHGLAHEAFVYDDDVSVRDRCVPFVTEALEGDQPVVVVAGEQVRGMLEDEFGKRTKDFTVFQAAEESWLGGAGTLSAYQDAMQPLLEAGRPWRLIGQPIWLTEVDGPSWSRYEAVANQALADYPYYSLCLHDSRRLDARSVEDQLRVHPMVWGGGAPASNPDYETTESFLRSVEPPWTQAPEYAVPLVLDDPRRALARVEAAMHYSVLDGRVEEARLAVYELVTNALRAAGQARLRRWVEGGTEVWEVSDPGPGMHAVTAGYVPPGRDLDSGRGLWLARSLADDATVRAEGPGTAVRLFFRLFR